MPDDEKKTETITETLQATVQVNKQQIIYAISYIMNCTTPEKKIVVVDAESQPYLMPESFRDALHLVCEVTSKVLGISTQEIAEEIAKNHKKSFSVHPPVPFGQTKK